MSAADDLQRLIAEADARLQKLEEATGLRKATNGHVASESASWAIVAARGHRVVGKEEDS